MGYTNYWYRPEVLDAEVFKSAVADCKKITDYIQKNFEVPLVGGDGTGESIFEDDGFFFNGVGDDAHEGFYILQKFNNDSFYYQADENTCFQFCKTARKPYDLAVQACLIVFQYYFKEDFKVSSDGRSEWETAGEVCQQILGYGEDFKFMSKKALL